MLDVFNENLALGDVFIASILAVNPPNDARRCFFVCKVPLFAPSNGLQALRPLNV